MKTPLRPRPEAQILDSFEALSKSQQKAIEDLHAHLESFLDAKLNPTPSDREKRRQEKPVFLPRIDEHRSSNVFLLDGARGSGKTTVLLSLLELWNAELQRSPTPFTDSFPDSIRKSDLLSRRRLLPIEILDMQPLAHGTSLRLQFAVRLYTIVAGCHGDLPDGVHGSIPPLAFAPDHEPKTVRAWRRLVRAVAAGEKTNLENRAKTLPRRTSPWNWSRQNENAHT